MNNHVIKNNQISTKYQKHVSELYYKQSNKLNYLYLLTWSVSINILNINYQGELPYKYMIHDSIEPYMLTKSHQ